MLNMRILKLHFKKRLYRKVRAGGRAIEIRLPILARLEHFEYDLRDSIGKLYSSLTSHAQSNENLQNIQLNSLIKPRYPALQNTALVGHFICRACLKKGLGIVECHRQTVESLVESCDKLSRIEIGNSAYLIGD